MSRIALAALAALAIVSAFGCGAPPEIDPEIAAALAETGAVDHHAHPRIALAAGEVDEDFDAIVLEGLEVPDVPVRLRPGDPAYAQALRALWGETDPGRAMASKQRIQEQQGEAYPAWVLDRLGIDVMLANRVSMGRGLEPARFRWIPFADALLYPLDNGAQKRSSPDYRAFYDRIEALRQRHLEQLGVAALPASFDDYLTRVVEPMLESYRQGGALGIKFLAAYMRSLDFADVDGDQAARVYARYVAGGEPPAEEYKALQDYLFRHIALTSGRLGLAVHLHTGVGGGSYFHVRSSNPHLLEPMLKAPDLAETRFVLVHGGWPFTDEAATLLTKPNVYADVSAMAFLLFPRAHSEILRDWLAWVPEKVLFGTDAYPYSPLMGWEESAWMRAEATRRALGMALTAMLADGEIERPRAVEVARMVLRDNAVRLYGLGRPTSVPERRARAAEETP